MAYKALRIFRKFFAYTLLTGFVLVVLGIAGTYIFQDKIISLTFAEINKRLTTKIEVDEKVGFSIIDKFPEISIDLKNVRVYENLPQSKDKLASFQNLYFTFDAFDFLKGRYVINNVYAEGGDVKIKIDKNGNVNYDIFKSDTASQSGISFDLKKIMLKDIMVQYISAPVNQYHQVHVKQAESRLRLKEKTWFIGLEGEFLVHQIGVAENKYLKDKHVTIISDQEYHEETVLFRILPSILKVEGSEFKVEGSYEGKSKNKIDLNITAEKSTVSTLVSLLPKDISNELSIYRSSGNIFLKGTVNGFITAEENPLVNIDFGFNDASFYHPEFDKKIEKATLNGFYTNGAGRNLKTSSLRLTDVNAFFTGKNFKGNFLMNDFNDPAISFDLQGSVDAKSLIKFYPVENISDASGAFDLNVSFKGRIDDLKTAEGKEKIIAKGEIFVKDLGFKVKGMPYPVKGLNGNFTFNKNDLVVKDFSGQLGKSDFLVNGTIKNFISKVIFHKESLILEGSVHSDMINMDELLSYTSSGKSNIDDKNNPYPYLSGYNIKLHCSIKKLIYRRLHASEMRGAFDFRQPAALLKNISFNTAGGKVHLNSLINFKSKEEIEFNTKFSLSNIHVDSVFYIFENFDQNFIVDKNLKGQFTGNTKLYFLMNSNFDINAPSVLATVDASILNGELNNFEPMKKLSIFIKERELENIKFSELKNKIIVKNSVVEIPEMEIKMEVQSNASTIKVEGTHTFDQHMDYKLCVTLKNFKKNHKDKDEAFGAIQEDKRGYTSVFLTMKGTADKYKIAPDTKKTAKKIKGDLKKEKKELENIFNNKRKEEVDNPSTPDEYEFFDF